MDCIQLWLRTPKIKTDLVLPFTGVGSAPSLGSLRSNDGNVNDNATNQWFDWLNEEK